MSTIDLKKLVSQRDVFPIINKISNLIKTPFAVWDTHSHLLLGKADGVYEKQHPITLEGDVLGQVSGDKKTALLASFLSFAAMREYEKKALTRETLHKYRDLSNLYEISKKLSATYTSTGIARLASNQTLSLFNATNVSIMLTGGEQGRFQVIAAAGTKNKQKTILSSDKGIAGRVLTTGQAEVVNDVFSDPQFVKGGNNISSLMCAPLRTKDTIMGVINVSSQESHTFSSEDLKLLASIAIQIGSALANSMLYEELNNYSEELRNKNIQLQTEVAERTLSEKAFKESEEKYRLHFDNVMDVIYSVDPDFMITSISPSIEKLLGYKPEEVTIKPFPELNMLTSESLERAYSDAKRILSGERVETAEYQFIAKDGSIKVGEVSSAPLFEDGKVIAVISVARDVTDRKKSQQKLTESEERFRTMAENITNGLIILEEGKTVFVNKRACEITGYSQEELMHMWGPNLTTFEEKERKDEIINDIQKTGVWPDQIETWMKRKDGSKCCVNLRFSFSSKAGQQYAGYVVVTDITEHKLAEEKLRDTTDFLNNVIESSQDGIVVSDQVGYLTRMNMYMLEKLGYKREEVREKHLVEFGPPETGMYKLASGGEVEIKQDYFDLQRTMVEILQDKGKVVDWEAYYCRKDRKLIPMEQSIFYLYDSQGERAGAVGILRDITERKKAEKRLRDTTDFLDNIIESSLDSIVVSDSKGKLQRVNKAFLQLLDCEENWVLGKMMAELSVVEEGTYETSYEEKIRIGKDHIDYLMDMLSRFVEEGKITNWESYVFRKDGKVIPVEVNIVKLYDEKGEQTGSVGIVRDITERRKSESEITETRDFLENIFESSIDPIIIGDAVGTITRTNQAFQKLLHYESSEIRGKHIGEFVPVEVGTYESRAGSVVELDDNFFREAEEKMAELVEGGSLAAWKSCYLGKDRKIIPVEQTISFLFDKHGERTGVVGISRDITERVKAEQEILQARDFLQDIIKTSLDGIVVTDALSTITMVNDAAVKILGYPRRELIGARTQDFLETGDELEERGKQIQKKLMKKKVVYGYEHKWTRKNGILVDLEISIALLKDPKGTLSGAVLSFRDVTERKKAEQKLVQSQEQLRSLASQLTLTEERERRRIATDLHDRIGQALAISKIKLGALRELTFPLGLGNDVDGIRDLIEQTIQDTRSLIFDLCPPFLYELGFEKAIEWLLEDIQTQHGVTTHFKSDGNPKPLDDDIRVLLYQSIRELFVNIVKHAQAENARLTIKSDASTITLSVEDDGRGFDENVTPFHMEKDKGFGLFRIQERFNYLGGEIKIKSKPDHGTKISLKLPFTINDHTDKEERK